MNKENTVTIIHYFPKLSLKGTPRGHYIKTIYEYIELLKDFYNVEVITNDLSAQFIEYNNLKTVKNHISANQTDYSGNLINKIGFLFKVLKNIINCIKKSSGSILIFLSPESTFYLIFPMLKCIFFKKKFAINIYQNRAQNYPTKIIKILTKYVYNNVDLILSSLKNLHQNNLIYIPDFFYDETKYDIINNKILTNEYFLCIGSISPKEKNYEELVTIFKNTDKELIIAGSFENKEYKLYLEELSKGIENITLILKFFDYKEYLDLMIKAKAVILPYIKDEYDGRSSGVLLETIYLNKPVIAPAFLLDCNEINGYGYDSIEDLKKILFLKNITPYDNSKLLIKNDINLIKNKLSERIKILIND